MRKRKKEFCGRLREVECGGWGWYGLEKFNFTVEALVWIKWRKEIHFDDVIISRGQRDEKLNEKREKKFHFKCL
jgi:hypothetical protein